ncbi:hydrophobic protein [Kitasatospora sp. NPDC017646]|uniref:hydrophobic protein n=1 Tax=Kitasatospora sp. NPDC017646 TaxID=3364024 RepID=UPI00379C949D
MILLVLILLLAIILGGVGFIVHALWWIALAVLVLWLLGFVFGRRGGSRWYRW